MNTLLTPEDSKRVADALIKKIEETDLDINDPIKNFLVPTYWSEDWFPLVIQEMCDKISHGVIDAAYEKNK